jgi:hypothetical protein
LQRQYRRCQKRCATLPAPCATPFRKLVERVRGCRSLSVLYESIYRRSK